MIATLIQIEWFGLLFWVASIFFVREPGRRAVAFWHFAGAVLSLGIPLYVASGAHSLPFRSLVQACSLGAVNGVLGMLWCSRVRTRVSALPMLALTVGGILGALVFVLSAARPNRLF
jgi:peptidoglycan/LPS O-acetylase OafA/YrhL